MKLMANVTISITFLTILKSKYIKYKIRPKNDDVVLKNLSTCQIDFKALAKLQLKTPHSSRPLYRPIFMIVASSVTLYLCGFQCRGYYSKKRQYWASLNYY